ncbi:MAG: tryptophan 7-halogenase, partial [Candidatus Angelobacter sp.]
MYDVVILGGGPAGTATALALKRLDSALQIALVEKAGYSAMRIGETLPPLAQMLLRELGVWEAFLATSPLASHGTRAAWGSSDFHENEFIFSPHGHGWHVDRTAFDAMLAAEAARAGIEVILPAAPYTSSRDGKHWTLAIKSREGGCRKLSSRFVVDATGPKAWFASRQGARHLVHDRLAAAFVIFQCDLMDTYTSVEACEHGWWYSAALPAQRMIAIFMADATDFRRMPWRQLDEWKALAALAPHTAARIAKANALG